MKQNGWTRASQSLERKPQFSPSRQAQLAQRSKDDYNHSLQRQIEQHETRHAKQRELTRDKQNLEKLEHSIRRMEMMENAQKEQRKGVALQMHLDNLSHQREVKRIAKQQEKRERMAIQDRWKRDDQIERAAAIQQQQMRDATRMSLQESHDKQRNFKMNRYIQQKVSDVHHAAAYDARVKELEHISYRDYYDKYKRRLQNVVTPPPIKSVGNTRKESLIHSMQTRGIESNEARQQRELDWKRDLERKQVQANIYNKQVALRKQREMERPYLNQSVASQGYANGAIGGGDDQPLNHSFDYVSQKNMSYFGRSPARSIASNAAIDSAATPSRLPGLPMRGKNSMADQIYNYDSIYNVFGRHYSRRVVSKSPKPKLIFPDAPEANNPYLSQFASANARTVTISPKPVPASLPSRKFSEQPATHSPHPSQHAQHQHHQQHMSGSRSMERIPPAPSTHSAGLLNTPKLAQKSAGRESRNMVGMRMMGQQQEVRPDAAGVVMSNPSFIPHHGAAGVSGHKKSSTIDYNPGVGKLGAGGGAGGALTGGVDVSAINAIDARIRNYQRLQDNLRSMRANKAMLEEYGGADRRAKEERLSHLGQFLIKS